MSKIEKIFAADGDLSRQISGYQPRSSQLKMALAVEKTIKQRETLIVEAETGTGKTLAYMIPALLEDKKKVIVSTGTKALQEQLFFKDVPTIKNAIKPDKKIVLLKGRANYLCLHRLDLHSKGSHAFAKSEQHDLVKIRNWKSITVSGDFGEMTDIEENSPILPFVTSTADNCLGSDCPQHSDCYLIKARRNAMEADAVVINHHLFFADMALKDTGFGELIPNADAIVFDEAHQLPDIASEYFGESISTRQIADLCKDVIAEYHANLTDVDALQESATSLLILAAELRFCFVEPPKRLAWHKQTKNKDLHKLLADIGSGVSDLNDVLKTCISRTQEIDNCYERSVQLSQTLTKFSSKQLQGIGRWYETTPKHVVLRQAPLHIADKFSELLNRQKSAWIFTSATLSINDDFEFYAKRMGIQQAKTMQLASPFDYQNQALLCLPRYLPEPSDPEMINALVNVALKLIRASNGKCFLLFTSYRMHDNVAAQLLSKCTNPLLIQGTTSKQALLKRFVSEPKSVLLGTSSFWEGVDVRGDSLVCVLIDKLPFAAPDDPLLEARIEDCRKNGGDPFAEIQLPQSVIALKQGAGRLIRDTNDKGVLVICDNRLLTRNYGDIFLSSLPAMSRTRSMEKTQQFLAEVLA